MKRLLCLLLLTAVSLNVYASSAKWASRLHMDGGGTWNGRLPISLTNPSKNATEGLPVAYKIEAGSPLVGQRAGSLRIGDDQGNLLKYLVQSQNGERLLEEPIVPGCILHIPLTAEGGATVTYHVYFGNDKAWSFPEGLQGVCVSDANGGFEKLKGNFPAGWSESMMDAQHSVVLSQESPAEGKYCLKATIKEGAAPSWFKAGHGPVRVIGGTKGVIRVKVRGKDTKGKAGWFVHVGKAGNSQMVNMVRTVPQDSFGWTELVLEFDIPEDAESLMTGTAFAGTGGTAWYDDFRLELERPEVQAQVKVGKPEYRFSNVRGRRALSDWRKGYRYRLPIRVLNNTTSDISNVLSSIDVAAIRNKNTKRSLLLDSEGNEVKTFIVGNMIFFKATAAAKTTQFYYLYVNDKAKDELESVKVEHSLGSDIPSDQILKEAYRYGDVSSFVELLSGDMNMLKNPSFEETNADGSLVGWDFAGEKYDAGAGWYKQGTPGGFGKYHAVMTLPESRQSDWVGWRQIVPVKSGHRYVYGGFVAAENHSKAASLHLHLLGRDRKVVPGGYASCGSISSKNSGWTPVFGIANAGLDVAYLQVHLTTNGHGTLRYDGMFMTEVMAADVEAMETQPVPEDQMLLWQVDSVYKVFQDTVPIDITGTPVKHGKATCTGGKKVSIDSPFGIELARNEEEPLQVAIRAGRSIKGLKASIRGLEDSGIVGTVGVVGYVPIDSRSNYYSNRKDSWIQLVPGGSGSSDGWAGMWPDPIKPINTFDLEANKTQPIWFSFKTNAKTRPGIYRGELVIAGNGVDIVLPFELNVWNFALPKATEFPALYDIRLSHHWNVPGKTWAQIRKDIYSLMRDKKLCPDKPAASPRFTRDKDGNIVADFKAYDEEATLYFDEMKFPVAYTPGFFYMFGWAHPPKTILGEKPFEGEYPWDKGESRRTLRPEYKKAYQTCLRLYMDHMREKGWDKKVVLYVSDEPHYSHAHVKDQMLAICEMIREVEPELLIYTSSWGHCKAWDGYISLWGAGHYGRFPEDEINERLKAGDTFWFTTDGQMCTDTQYAGIERLLPHYCFKYGARAYEFWGATWLTLDPWKYGWHSFIRQSDSPTQKPYWVRYPNGDGYIMYPGQEYGGLPVTSVRMEAARDGVDDYEYLTLLAADTSSEAKAILEQVKTLVDMPSAGGRFTSKFMLEPWKVRAYRSLIGEYLNKKAGK